MSDPTFQARGRPDRAPGVAHARVSVSCWRTRRTSVAQGCWATVARGRAELGSGDDHERERQAIVADVCKSASRPTTPA